MKTHIIIPIKDIEDGLENARMVIKAAKTSEAKIKALGEADTFSFIKHLGKQVSLDERDIKERAESLALANDYSPQYEDGYRQALIDLLRLGSK